MAHASSILDTLGDHGGFYERILPELFRREIPRESKATCEKCAMCAPARSPAESSEPPSLESIDGRNRLYRVETKCCTYHPRLPNYRVGAILADPSPEMAEGRARIRVKLSARVGVTPLGVDAPAKYSLLYDQGRDFFGRALSMRCPYYESEGGLCTIWRYREAVCSTFFCKYVSGQDGLRFWKAIKSYLGLVETQLSRLAILRLYPEYIADPIHRVGEASAASGAARLTLEELEDQAMPPRAYSSYWRRWEGREEEFYRACHDTIRALSADDVERALGLDGTISRTQLEQAYAAAVSPALPERLRLNADATVKWLSDGAVALGSYSENDALALPGEAYRLITEFTGRETVTETRKRLREELQADLSDEILLELYRHRVLVTP